MKRRTWLQTGSLALLGCNKNPQAATAALKAGPSSVNVPTEWLKTAIVEDVPLKPLYSSAEWKDFQSDKKHRLKPGYGCRPRHWALRFPAAAPTGIYIDWKEAGEDHVAPQILIHKADEWSVAFTDGVHEETKSADLLHALRSDIDAALTQDHLHLSPAFMDASLTFQCLKRRIEFKGGHGIRLVAQWSMEAELMLMGELHYLFLGISDDNTCQIIATFPLSLPGLPARGDKTHLGRSLERYGEFERGFNQYEAEAKRWLETHAAEITPSVQTLDSVMQSLVATHWA